jgi:hypothetical protein
MVLASPERNLSQCYYFTAQQPPTVADVIPRVDVVSIKEWNPQFLGEGGDGGAKVYRISEKMILKEYTRSWISSAEKAFIARFLPLSDNNCLELSLQRHLLIAEAILTAERQKGSSSSSSLLSTPNRNSNASCPNFPAPPTKRDQGIIAPYIGVDLLTFLKQSRSITGEAANVTLSFSSNFRCPNIFLREVAFAPMVRTDSDLDAVRAIMYQLTLGIAFLNTLQHQTCAGVTSTGFSHNDIHLGNVLLHRPTGTLVICDFEHLRSIDVPDPEKWPRLPPNNRHSPNGCNSRNCDTWGLGLIAVSLLTGVSPLFDDHLIMNDFLKGPENPVLLPPEHDKDDGVIDWDGVILPFLQETLPREAIRPIDDILQYCAKCLNNKMNVGPEDAQSLLDHEPMFNRFRHNPEEARTIVALLCASHER